jgi:N-acetylglutamate synthase-like GNAT family acetyltransferase
MHIRDAAEADTGEIAALLAELGYPMSQQDTAERLRRFAADPMSRVLVAVLSGNVVGLVATHIVPRLDSDALSGRVTDIVVKEEPRRRGVGAALMAAAEDEARRQGAHRLDLSSGDWRADAYAFYKRLGFESHAASFVKDLASGRRRSRP